MRAHPAIRYLMIIAIAALASGCAYMNPYIDAHPRTAAGEMGGLPQSSKALADIDRWAEQVESKHKDTSRWNRGLNLATFGLAAGAVIAPIYNAYKDLTTALAMGAATSYAGNTLFFASDQLSLYGAAQTSLGCIQQRGEALGSAMPEGSAERFDADFWRLVGSRVEACAADTDYLKLQATFNAAFIAIQRVQGSDAPSAARLRHAGQNVVIALNREIDKRSPTPEAVFAAAKSLAPFSAGFGAPSATQPRAAVAAVCPDESKAFFAAQVPYYAQRQRAAEVALDGINDLDAACVFNAPVVADLALDQDKVVLVEGASVNVNIRGGRPPYEVSWVVEPAANAGVTLSQPLPDRMNLRGTSGIKDQEYKIIVRDSSASGRTRTLPVVAKKT